MTRRQFQPNVEKGNAVQSGISRSGSWQLQRQQQWRFAKWRGHGDSRAREPHGGMMPQYISRREEDTSGATNRKNAGANKNVVPRHRRSI
jgi:hypothetical protein